MKIAWFTHRYAPCIGGAEAYGRAMVSRFVASGHEADVYTSDAHELWYFTDPTRKRVDPGADQIIDGARLHRLPVRHFAGQKYVGRLLSYAPHWPTRCRWESFMPVIPDLFRIRGRYDAVFAVGYPFTVFSYAAYRLAKASRCPLVLTPFLHLSTPGDPVSRHYTRPHQMRLLSKASVAVAVTELEARAMRRRGVPADRILVLPMALDHKAVTGGDRAAFRERLGIPADRLVVGQLGALDPNKGTCDLVRAVAAVNARREPGERPVHLVLAGAPSPDFDRFLLENIPWNCPWLSLLGPIPQRDVPDLYAALDVFAMPSRTDSFGIVFLEAWANRKPVIAAAAGGVTEVVRDGETGLLVPFGDVDAIAAGIERLDRDRDFARQLAARGEREAAAATWDRRFDDLNARLLSVRERPAFRGPHAPRKSRVPRHT